MNRDEIIKESLRLSSEGKTAREIYNEFYLLNENKMSFQSFKRRLPEWKSKVCADDYTLKAGTYEGFTAKRATVQLNGNGDITQAWIKQERQIDEEYLKALEDSANKIKAFKPIETKIKEYSKSMLEIPLFDMHFGVCDFDYYKETLSEIAYIIQSKQWDEINILVGQDLFHNDDFRGRTSKGTPIEAVDMEKATENALNFYCQMIGIASACAKKVNISYTEGNHDETVAWYFCLILQAKFVEFKNCYFEVSRSPRKCISWEEIFVGYGHCETGRTSPADIRSMFTIEFPLEFAKAETREIHLGHLHTQQDIDLFGVMIRRLCTGNKTDSWHKKNGYVGNHKRFEIFEYVPNKLKAIYYV